MRSFHVRIAVGFAFLIAACSPGTATTVAPPVADTTSAAPAEAQAESGVAQPATATQSEADAAPTSVPTEVPLAARVNGGVITQAEYEREVARAEAAFAIRNVDPATQGDYRAQVLETMIDDRLRVQAAIASGHAVSPEEVQAAYEQTVAEAESEAAFAEWLELNLYTPEEFRQVLHDGLLGSAIYADVVAAVPETAEQVRARHILVPNQELAEDLLAQLAAGADFATLAISHSQDQSTRINGGELGWFPRGVLTVQEVEAAAFDLAPGERSAVIRTFLGFHIVETLEHDSARRLSPEVLPVLREARIEEWMAELRAQATIERYVP